MPNFHVKIIGRDRDAMLELVRKHKIDVARNTAEKIRQGYSIHAHATDSQVHNLETAGYKVERLEDADKAGMERQKEIKDLSDKTALFTEGLAAGRLPHYLSVADVEHALTIAASPPNNTFVKLIKLPNKSWENRPCTAIKVGKGSSTKRPGIFFLGGVHAREWGSPDILIFFLAELILAYRNNKGITIGSNKFTAAQIKALVETKDIYLLPQANPDGRNYSMTQEPMWRKNRRVLPRPGCVGVDINRNYDFLWNYPQYFAPAAAVQNSTDPANYQVYIGPSAVSEPETKNVVWMFDAYPNIRYLIDLHSYSESILFNWGDDDDQSANPDMNFKNPIYNDKRGVIGDSIYGEFIAAGDKTASLNLAKVLRDAIKKVRGRIYKVEQSVELYPTAGVSTDYAYARHLINPDLAKVQSFTLEWGNPQNPTPFHPPYPEMQKIIREITAALLAFCMKAS